MAQQHPMSLVRPLALQQVLMQRGTFPCPPRLRKAGQSEGHVEQTGGQHNAGPVAAIHADPEPSSTQSGKALGSGRAGFSSPLLYCGAGDTLQASVLTSTKWEHEGRMLPPGPGQSSNMLGHSSGSLFEQTVY